MVPPHFSRSGFNRYSASILPYTIDRDGRWLLLLGQERHDGTWCGFGGRMEPRDLGDPWRTALREFHEETLGVMMNEIGDLFLAAPERHVYDRISHHHMFVIRLPHFNVEGWNTALDRIYTDPSAPGVWKEKRCFSWFPMTYVCDFAFRRHPSFHCKIVRMHWNFLRLLRLLLLLAPEDLPAFPFPDPHRRRRRPRPPTIHSPWVPVPVPVPIPIPIPIPIPVLAAAP